jgi:hypothetical protein
MFTLHAVQLSLLNRDMFNKQRPFPSAATWEQECCETYKLSAPTSSAEIAGKRERSLGTPRTFLRSVELSTCFQFSSTFPFFVGSQSRTFSLFNDESVSGIGLYGFRNKMMNSNTSTADLQHNLCILVSRGHVASHPRGESSILKHLFSRTQSLQGNARAFYLRYGDVETEKCSHGYGDSPHELDNYIVDIYDHIWTWIHTRAGHQSLGSGRRALVNEQEQDAYAYAYASYAYASYAYVNVYRL